LGTESFPFLCVSQCVLCFYEYANYHMFWYYSVQMYMNEIVPEGLMVYDIDRA